MIPWGKGKAVVEGERRREEEGGGGGGEGERGRGGEGRGAGPFAASPRCFCVRRWDQPPRPLLAPGDVPSPSLSPIRRCVEGRGRKGRGGEGMEGDGGRMSARRRRASWDGGLRG